MKKIISIEELAEEGPREKSISIEQLIGEKPKLEPVDWPFTRGPNMNGFIDLSEGKGELRVLFQYADDYLYCLDKGGNQKWRVKMPGRFEYGFLHNPAVTDTGIFFSTADYLTCLDFDGKEKWKKEIYTGGNILSPPVIKNNLIAVSTGSFSILLDIDGKILWKERTNASTIGALMLDDMIIFPDVYEGIVATNYDGKKLWESESVKAYSDVVFDKDRFYVKCMQEHNICVLDLKGKVIDYIKLPGNDDAEISAPTVKDGRLYMNYIDREGIGDPKGGFFCTDRDGNLIWKKKIKTIIARYHSEHPSTVYKDRLLIPSSCKLLCYSLDGENIGSLESIYGGLQPAVTDDFFVYCTDGHMVQAGNHNNLKPMSTMTKNLLHRLYLKDQLRSKKILHQYWEFKKADDSGKRTGRPVIYRK